MTGYDTPFERAMRAVQSAGLTIVGHRDGKARTCCPVHNGSAPDSLAIGVGHDKQLLLHCFAGCEFDDVRDAIGLTKDDCRAQERARDGRKKVVASYAYPDANGKVRYWQDRFFPKTFRPRLPDGSRSLPRELRILYRLPAVLAEVAACGQVWLVEGERDADNLAAAGPCSTTMPGGTGMGWQESYTDTLVGAAEVVIVADRDDAGEKHAQKVARSLSRRGIPHRIVQAAAGKDITDHLAAGLGADDLVPFAPAEDAPEQEPSAADEELPPDPFDMPDPNGMSSEDYFEAKLKALAAELLDTDDLDHIPALEPIIDDVLFRDTLGRLYGASGSFKSFMTLDMAGAVGTGKDWHGRRTQQGEVIYLVAEGIKGIRKRVRAWEQYHGVRMTGVKFLPRPVQAMDDEWLLLIELCRMRQPALIIVDTQARVTVGIEENSNTEMGRVVDRVEQLRAASGACVLLVHHTGHDSERGRGATAVKGALQTEIGVVRTGKGLHDSQVTLKTGKQKDDEELGDITFVLHQVLLDGEAKEDGTPVSSIVLVPLSSVGQPQAATGQQGRVEEIAAALDAAEVPVTYGRDRMRRECERLGIKARDALLSDVAKYRKEHPRRPEKPVPEPVPDLLEDGTA